MICIQNKFQPIAFRSDKLFKRSVTRWLIFFSCHCYFNTFPSSLSVLMSAIDLSAEFISQFINCSLPQYCFSLILALNTVSLETNLNCKGWKWGAGISQNRTGPDALTCDMQLQHLPSDISCNVIWHVMSQVMWQIFITGIRCIYQVVKIPFYGNKVLKDYGFSFEKLKTLDIF